MPDANERVWNRRDVVETYASRSYITPAEVRVIASCWASIAGGAVLDIGVGAGRTIPYLEPLARSYIAVDYMPAMIDEARRRHPGVDIRQADARELPLRDGELSFALFSFNGIDYVDPEDRARILAEVHRVLAPGGVFAYSTHNLAARTTNGFELARPHVRASRPIRAAVAIARGLAESARGYRNYRRLADRQRTGDEIAFVVDGAHEYSILTCYVTQAYERRALEAAGFRVREVIDRGGRLADASSRSRDLYFVVER